MLSIKKPSSKKRSSKEEGERRRGQDDEIPRVIVLLRGSVTKAKQNAARYNRRIIICAAAPLSDGHNERYR